MHQCTLTLVFTLSMGLTLNEVPSVRADSTTSPGNDMNHRRQTSSSINCKQWPENKSGQQNHKEWWLEKQRSSGRKKTSLKLRKPQVRRFQLLQQLGARAQEYPSSPPGLLPRSWNKVRFHHLASRLFTVSTLFAHYFRCDGQVVTLKIPFKANLTARSPLLKTHLE